MDSTNIVMLAIAIVISFTVTAFVFGVQQDAGREVLEQRCNETFGEGNWTMKYYEIAYCEDDETGETLDYNDIHLNLTSQASVPVPEVVT